eukprot:NODE_30_length_37342_cov_0.449507.p15 type:complete len:286 gc:universal NODE_30_length_37342_cov_0.449507:3816-2959(-)
MDHILAGAIAGFTTTFISVPFDVIKTRLQNNTLQSSRFIFITGLIKIYKQEGLKGNYRGLSPTLMGYLPTWAIYFSLYETLKDKMHYYEQKGLISNYAAYSVSAMSAGVCSTAITNPLWVIRTRFMVLRQDTSVFRAIQDIYQRESFYGFFRGLTPSLLGTTHVAIQFPIYEFSKDYLLHMKTRIGKKTQLNTLDIFLCSSIAKMSASCVTYPHEVIRTRLHTQTPIRGSKNYNGIRKMIIMVYREAGWRSFYRGMGTNLIRTVPASACTLITYEYSSALLKDII